MSQFATQNFNILYFFYTKCLKNSLIYKKTYIIFWIFWETFLNNTYYFLHQAQLSYRRQSDCIQNNRKS